METSNPHTSPARAQVLAVLTRFAVGTLIALTVWNGPYIWSSGRQWVDDRMADRERWLASLPPRPLPIRPEDFERYPRGSFGFVLSYGYGNRIDTFAGTVTEYRVGIPDTTIALALTEAEMDTIYRTAIEMRLFELPEPHPPFGRNGLAYTSHSTTTKFVARAGSATRTITWKNRTLGGPPSDDWKRVYRLILLIRETIERRPEYRALYE